MSESPDKNSGSTGNGVEPSTTGSHSVDLTAEGVRIDGVLFPALTVSALTELLGEPRVEPPAEPGSGRTTWVIWDGFGARAATRGGDEVHELSIEVADDPAWRAKAPDGGRRFFPTGSLPGPFTIDGRPPVEAVPEEALRKARALLSTNVGQWDAELFLSETECGAIRRMEMREWFAKYESGELADMVSGADRPFRGVSIIFREPTPVKKSSGKWNLPAATEPVLDIASFPFRLAIVQELMYEQDVLTPRFDVHHFAQDQGAESFDPNEFANKVIPSVRTWFRELPIPTRLAENVETLVLDGGNDIYLQLIPQWDGEDESFTIETLSDDDLAPFTRLREVDDIGGFLGPEARATLEARGITVD